MKKAFYAVLAVAASLLLIGTVTAAPGDGITDSSHDFRNAQGWQETPSLCEACHTPHNADPDLELLWNRTLPEGGNYDNTLTTAFDTNWGTPDGPTLLCLSCHDGTLALDNFGGLTGGTAFIEAEYQIGDGTSLSGNHPVSIDYPQDPELVPDEFVSDAVIRQFVSEIRLYGETGSTRVHCGSCHDVHNKNVVDEHLLRLNENSICLGCHNKGLPPT